MIVTGPNSAATPFPSNAGGLILKTHGRWRPGRQFSGWLPPVLFVTDDRMNDEMQPAAPLDGAPGKIYFRFPPPIVWMAGAALFGVAATVLCSAERPNSSQSNQTHSGLLVEVTRGPLVESRHYGRLVAVTPEGEIRKSVGDPHALILPRSALKPLQALATVQLALEMGVELSSEEIAIMCASHSAEPRQLEAALALLNRAGAAEEQLHCGPEQGRRLRHNCSGKHGGMLVLASLSSAPANGYWEPGHPVQRAIQRAIREFTGHDQPLQWGTDGCGVPNYALPLYSLALGYARLASPENAPIQYQAAAAAIRKAMLAHPGHLSSDGSFHARLIETGNGNFIGKAGAEACYGFGVSEPALGVALKIEDGNNRGLQPLLLAALDRLGAMTAEADRAAQQSTLPITNSRGEIVGEIRVADW
jgi:L-asparaginase II